MWSKMSRGQLTGYTLASCTNAQEERDINSVPRDYLLLSRANNCKGKTVISPSNSPSLGNDLK